MCSLVIGFCPLSWTRKVLTFRPISTLDATLFFQIVSYLARVLQFIVLAASSPVHVCDYPAYSATAYASSGLRAPFLTHDIKFPLNAGEIAATEMTEHSRSDARLPRAMPPPHHQCK